MSHCLAYANVSHARTPERVATLEEIRRQQNVSKNISPARARPLPFCPPLPRFCLRRTQL